MRWLPLAVLAIGCGGPRGEPAADAPAGEARLDGTDAGLAPDAARVDVDAEPLGHGGAPDAGDAEAPAAAADAVDSGETGDALDADVPRWSEEPPSHGWSWKELARKVVDRQALPAAFRDAGYRLPAGAEVYAVRIVHGVGGPAYVGYQAGGGAFSQDFWPASTIKVLAAVAALEHLHALGFTGAASVTFEDGERDTVRAICDRALRVSSNRDYDRTVLIAGLDRLNDRFLTPRRGFPATVLVRSYTGDGVAHSPELLLEEGGRRNRVPAREAEGDYHCEREGNCTDLFELIEGLRRVVLDGEIPERERYALDPADVAALREALCHEDNSYFLDGAVRALGETPRLCHKTGSYPGDDFLDHALVEVPSTGERFLLAAAVPDQGGREASEAALSGIAEQVLRALRGRDDGFPLQPDGGLVVDVHLSVCEGPRRGPWDCRVAIAAPGADRVELWVDGRKVGEAGGGPAFEILWPRARRGAHLGVVRAASGADWIGYRAVRLTPSGRAGEGG